MKLKNLFLNLSYFICFTLVVLACNPQKNEEKSTTEETTDKIKKEVKPLRPDLPLDQIKLPKGFKISVFAEVENARSMTISPKGTIYVGNRKNDKVYAVRDNDGDGVADKVYVIAKGLDTPNGVAFKDGSLYVAEISRILRFDNIEQQLDNPPQPVVVYDKYPTEKHHGWKFIAFGPDGKLYVPVGAPCNLCERTDNEVFATITRMNPDGSDMEIFAKGVRNSVGFTWHPDTKELWFTDNGRDMLGDDTPDDELNLAPKKGMHFGFPYCFAGDVKDPEFGNKRPCSDFIPPVEKMGAHVASLGLRFYQGGMFPGEYKKQLFIAKHGSGNRTEKSGYMVSTVKLNGNKAAGHEVFAEGWLDKKTQKAWGRPVDIQELPDGSLLVSDDEAGVIYRIWYEG